MRSEGAEESLKGLAVIRKGHDGTGTFRNITKEIPRKKGNKDERI